MTSFLNDDLLRQLIAVGQVDVVVGVPTFNHASTIAATIQATEQGLARTCPRERTVIMSADGGSRDGTPDVVRDVAVSAGGRRGHDSLRTRHVISGAYSGLPNRGGAMQLILAAADLLQARAIVVIDPDVTTMTPAWIDALTTPIVRRSVDFVSPIYDRHPLEAPLVSQLVRPVLGATFGREIQEPLLGDFGCSGRFAAACLARYASGDGFARPGMELLLVTAALTGGFAMAQAFLGPRRLAPTELPRPGLNAVFPQYVGALFASLHEHGGWQQRTGSEPVTRIGEATERTASPPVIDAASIGESFGRDVTAMRSILESILAPETLTPLWQMVETSEALDYDDDLWVTTVYDFLSAHHAGVMDRVHITQALLPLYRGRLASFLTRHTASGPDEVEQDLERLSRQFERRKPYLIERWNRSTTR